MNPRRSFFRKIGYLVAIAVLLVPLFWLGQPATEDVQGAKGSPGGKLAQAREACGLNQARLGEIDPASETLKLATLGMRGVAANILWEKANNYKKKKDWTNLSATLNQITKLQPNFISVWRFQAWNLSYNVSAEFDDYRERYRWVIKGIEFLKKGIKYNELSSKLLWDTGWFVSQKIGRSDEKKQFRRLFKADDDFHGSRPVDRRDNWLVGREWYLKAEELVDTKGVPIQGTSPLIFRSDASMCLMNYADALETDGTFGDKAKRAWIEAAESWRRYGTVEIPTSKGQMIRLGDYEVFQEELKKLEAQLDALEPGLAEKIRKEKESVLTDEEREAYDTPMAARTPEQHEMAARVAEALKVSYREIANRISGPNRKEAQEIAKRARKLEEESLMIRRYRSIVNYDYWALRAQVEQDDLTLAARKRIYEGDQAFAEGDLVTAKIAYDEGLAGWRQVLDKYPALIPDGITGDDLMVVIKRYHKILEQLDEPFPQPFVLQDILDRHGDQK